jgi:hypothetical protein
MNRIVWENYVLRGQLADERLGNGLLMWNVGKIVLFLFKGTLTPDFRPLFFSSNNFPWVLDTQVEAFSNMASNIFANNSTHCFFYKEIWLGCTQPSGVFDTSVTLDLIFERLWLPLKGISIEKNIVKLFCTIPITFTHIDTAVKKIGDVIVGWFSSRIRSNIQKGFNPCIWGPWGSWFMIIIIIIILNRLFLHTNINTGIRL